ncbi:MAG: hypothetical protein ACREU2_11570 [Steroidobacteraceae bacterium]
MNALSDEQRQRVLQSIGMAELVLQASLENLTPEDPERSSVAGALNSLKEAALALEPIEGAAQ